MVTNLVRQTLLVGGLLAAGLAVQGAPLQRADLPANPSWVLHVNVDALRPTSLGKFIQSEMDKPQNQARLAVFQSLFSFDLRTQLHGVTLYSAGADPQDGVLIVYADFDPAKLTNLAKAAKDPKHTAYKSHTIYSWLDERRAKQGGSPRVYAAIQGSRVLFGQRETTVADALDVLDGTGSTLASGKVFHQLGAPGDTSFIEAAATKMDWGAQGPNALLFRLSKQARLQLNEAHGKVNATLALQANDDPTAQQMLLVGQGLIGLMKLQPDKPEAATLADALAVKREGAEVFATLSLPADDVVHLIKARMAREAAKKAERNAAEDEAK